MVWYDDDALWGMLRSINNTLDSEHNQAWLYIYRLFANEAFWFAMGILRVVQVAPSAFLASVASSTNLVHVIFSAYHQSLPVPSIDVALAQQSENHMFDPPQGSASCKQKGWDDFITAASCSVLLV